MPPATTQLRIESLSKSFKVRGGGTLPVLAEIDLEVERGRLVCLVGPSGCGKSTLLNLIAGLDQPDAGSISLAGAAAGETADQRLGRVSYMPQEDLLMPWRTVLDNTIVALEMAGVGRRQARARAREQLAGFGLAGFEAAWPSQISSGMRQRAALLRTFLAGNELMLLDEPFAALDALTRRQMQQWLLDVHRRRGHTILFVTHDVEEALFLADRVYVMSSRPARIALRLEVELPRPRDLEQTTLDPAFIELKRRLLEPLRDSLAPPASGPEGSPEEGAA